MAILKGICSTQVGLQRALNNKFIKRLFSFLRTDKHSEFRYLPWSPENMMIPRLGCQLIETMLSTQIGRKHPFFVDWLNSIFKALYEEMDRGIKPNDEGLNPMMLLNTASSRASVSMQPGSGPYTQSGSSPGMVPKTFRPFARENLDSKLCREYFTFLKLLSSHPQGFEVFHQVRRLFGLV